MKVLVMGGNGMLGHTLAGALSREFETYVTLRGKSTSQRAIGRVDATDTSSVKYAIDRVQPNVVVNCIGVVKQSGAARIPRSCIAVNALFPHVLNDLCIESGARLIHISTDCVFDGAKGGYVETDATDAADLYGRTKALGEVTGRGALTLRTSIIGRELETAHGLVEWFLSNGGGTVKGYRGARFSGLTTILLSRVISKVIKERPTMSGLYHVASEPIDKCSLLSLLNSAFGANVVVVPSDEVSVDRTLDGTKFKEETGFVAPSWAKMVEELATVDPKEYERRKLCC